MEKAERNKHKIHFLILPFPAQGHVNPMIQFSKRLADHKGIRITIATPEYLLKGAQEISGSIFLETISDGTDEGYNPSVNLHTYLARFQEVGTQTVSELLEKLRNLGSPVDCVIYDAFLPWGLVVAKKFGLLSAAFFTQSCSVNTIWYNVHKGQLKVPLVDTKFLLPGLPPLEISDLPSFVYDQETYPGTFEMLLNQFQNVEDADFVFANTIYELEKEAIDWLTKVLPVKTIGPTIPSMYLDRRLLEDTHYGLNMFKPDNACMKWLDERATRSVIYVSFGSMANVEGEQMEELALSLKMTDKYFLWVVRSSEESKLPENFAQETSDKGLIVSWCPQLEILAHDAIGCFVTHCGWNSTLEALCLGVPMVAVPWWSDQNTNAKLVMDVWKMGIRAFTDEKNIIRHEEMVRCIKHVTEGETGENIRTNARHWKELAREAIDEGGTSDRNIHEFVSTILRALPPK